MLVATVLTIFSVNTLQLLIRIGLEKSFFIPVIVSAVFFWYGSLTNVVFSLCLQSMPGLIVAQEGINFLHQVTLLIGLSILTYGVFSYWRVTRQVKIPKHERLKKHKEQREVKKQAGRRKQSSRKIEEIEQESASAETNDQPSQSQSGIELVVPESCAMPPIEEGSLQAIATDGTAESEQEEDRPEQSSS
jgi:hypothetical protein